MLSPASTASLFASITAGGPGPFQQAIRLRFVESPATLLHSGAHAATPSAPPPHSAFPDFEITVPVKGTALPLFAAEPSSFHTTITPGQPAPQFLLRTLPPRSPPVVEVLAEQDHVRFTPRSGPYPGTVAVTVHWNGLPLGAPASGTARVFTRTTQGTGTIAVLVPYQIESDLPVRPAPARLDFDWTTPGTSTTMELQLNPVKGSLPLSLLRLRLLDDTSNFAVSQPNSYGRAVVVFSPTQRGFFRSHLVVSDVSGKRTVDLFVIPLSGGAP
jgi:hypothetical protein